MPEVSLQLFFSYSHKDEALRDELAKHLSILERQSAGGTAVLPYREKKSSFSVTK